MHTVLRYHSDQTRLAIVISGRATDPVGAVFQLYDKHKHGKVTMLSEKSFTDERTAIAAFETYCGYHL